MANKNQQTAPEVQEQVNKAEAFFEGNYHLRRSTHSDCSRRYSF